MTTKPPSRATRVSAPIMPTARTATIATAITMGLHGICTLTTAAPGLVAPVAAVDFGVDPSRVGVVIALLYVGVMPASLACGAVLSRLSDMRAAQLSGWLCALAMALAALAGTLAQWVGPEKSALAGFALIGMLSVASITVGLGYGMLNPVGSQILFRATPPGIRAFVFSIKQSAVPVGQMLAGLLLPAAMLAFGWQASLFGVASLIALYALAMYRMRLATSGDVPLSAPPAAAAPGAQGALRALLAPVRRAWANRPLRDLAWVGMLYSVNQLCLLTYLVSYLNLELGLSLLLAGSIFSASQLGGMLGRLTWGYVADRWVTPRVQLGVLGIVGGVCGVLTALMTPAWPLPAIVAICLVYGATAVAWNGVFFAEVAQACPKDEVGGMTGALQFYMSFGGGLGPLLFAGLVSAIGIYAPGFALFALPSLLLGVHLVRTGTGRSGT